MHALSACGPRWRPSRLLYLVLFNYYNQLSISSINHYQPVPLVSLSFSLPCTHDTKALYVHRYEIVAVCAQILNRYAHSTAHLRRYVNDFYFYFLFFADINLASNNNNNKNKYFKRQIRQPAVQHSEMMVRWRGGVGGVVEHQGNVEVADSSRAHENNGAESTSLRPFIPL